MELWCGRCDDWREEPHDCPYVGGVRFFPSRPEVEEPVMPTPKPSMAKKWCVELIAFVVTLAGIKLLYEAAFWFLGWLDR